MTPVFREQTGHHSPPFAWSHRIDGQADIYFLSNQELRQDTIEVAFRITDRAPELWNPATGEIRNAGIWRQENGRTLVPVRFDPAGSWFVVFRRAIDGDPVTSITPATDKTSTPLPDLWIENNHAWVTTAGTWEITRSSGKTQRITAAGAPRPRILTNPWTVWFPDARGAPPHVDLPALISLSEHPTQGVRHFSGTASYTCRFDATAPPSGDRLFLDLGRVANLAEITLNDRPLGVHWKPPFILDITAALRPGSNTLTIAVTNTWRNRLIGDIALPDHQRTTWRWNPENHTLAPIDTLDPSGLLGPVVIRTARGIILDPPTRKE